MISDKVQFIYFFNLQKKKKQLKKPQKTTTQKKPKTK